MLGKLISLLTKWQNAFRIKLKSVSPFEFLVHWITISTIFNFILSHSMKAVLLNVKKIALYRKIAILAYKLTKFEETASQIQPNLFIKVDFKAIGRVIGQKIMSSLF